MRLATLTERCSYLVDRWRGRLGVWTDSPLSPLDRLQHLLRLAGQCPSGPAGDDIRRAACELIETDSDAVRHSSRHRILTAVAGAESRRTQGRSREDDPAASTLKALNDALR